MRPTRTPGQVQPGINWGPFTLRIPFYHTRPEWPEFLQGIFVAGATGLAVIHILVADFGLTFEEAVACAFIQSVLIGSATIVFGEPFAPGWITPALPLVLNLIATTGDGESELYSSSEKFQLMTAVSLNFAILLFLLGVTGLGKRFILWLPDALKGGIILGAAIAALKRILVDDADRFLDPHPVSTIVAVSCCLILSFSIPFQRWKRRYKPLALIASLGLLPGFVAAAIVGSMVPSGNIDPETGKAIPELVFNFQWGFQIPPFADMLAKASPFSIGWPTMEMYLTTFPLALIGYVIVFGDLITGHEILKDAIPDRPDDKIEVDFNRSHYSLAIRNVLMGLFAPLFPTQGALWTGVHVIIVQRWREGAQSMESLYSGIASYYVFGIPMLYLVTPVIMLLSPLLGIALALTLILTGFACAYVAMGIPKTQIERGVAILTAVCLAFFSSPWIGMAVGVLATIFLVGFPTKKIVEEADDTPSNLSSDQTA
ncbi:hypothetical protein Pla110_21390 [Polystyrenella longa]|uniref:Permease family protein n=1 Tax=Polystyrenella longa TaxID=2528007 RepID=A0A518CME9_9PLAN|nr:hypothetical protein [Polystyrenella longa]QDU80410.1 hypothetical protein Pla110_21390 [Polystyrenella longa]